MDAGRYRFTVKSIEAEDRYRAVLPGYPITMVKSPSLRGATEMAR